MRDLISQGDLDYIKTQYPDKSIRMPSLAQQQMIMAYLRGMTPAAIARSLGESSHAKIARYLKTASCQAIVDFLRTNEFNDVRASRDYLTDLLFQSYHKAATVAEEVMAIREIGKLNDLYKSDQNKGTQINIQSNVTNIRQFETMTEGQLLEMAQNIPCEQPKLAPYLDNVPLLEEEAH